MSRTSSNSNGRILVILQLEGGNDGLNTVIPYADDEYYKARPGIAIARDAVLKLDDNLGLHPQLGRLQGTVRRRNAGDCSGRWLSAAGPFAFPLDGYLAIGIAGCGRAGPRLARPRFRSVR